MNDFISNHLYCLYFNSNIINGLNNTTKDYNKIRNDLNKYSSQKNLCIYDIYTEIDEIITSPIYMNDELLFKEKIKSKLSLLNVIQLNELSLIIGLGTNIIVNNDTKKKKLKIPAIIKKLVWNTYIGENIGKSKCLCCKNIDITQLNFTCGHYISEHNGGKITVENMRPICSSCNLSMGTTNMNEFILNYFFE